MHVQVLSDVDLNGHGGVDYWLRSKRSNVGELSECGATAPKVKLL